MKLRVGVIGLGEQWLTMHRPALRMLTERFDVRAIYCTVAKLAENAATEFQADAVDGYEAMIQRDDIDAVLVLEQSWLGHLPALAACRGGKAIYWAGGSDFDPHADAPFRACIEDSGIAFMSSFPKRFAPATLRLKELIATSLGQPRLLFCHKRLSSPEKAGAVAKPCKTRDRQQLRSELIEMIDWCSYVVGGRAESVMSANCMPSDPWDYRALSLRFNTNPARKTVDLPASAAKIWETRDRSGNRYSPLKSNGAPDNQSSEAEGTDDSPVVDSATAQISCGNYIPAAWPEAIGFRPPAGMQVCCERGVAFIDLPASLVWFDDAGRHQESLDDETSIGEKMLAQFHRAVTSLVRNLSGLDDAFNASAILRGAERSSEAGQRIPLD